MRRFAETAERISQTSSKLAKTATLADYLRSLSDDDLRAAATFFTGRPFPLCDARTLNVGWAALIRAVQEIAGASDDDIHDAYLARGDLGEVAERLLPERAQRPEWTPAQVAAAFAKLAEASGAAAKQAVVTELFRGLTPVEAKYVIKIISGDLRIGLKENTVEESIAKAFERNADLVRRMNMSLGDIGETALAARYDRLHDFALRLFRPVKFMLATAVEAEDDVFSNFNGPFYVEDKYDGIRAQLHRDASGAAIYSRTLDDVSRQFPEIVEEAMQLGPALILDGEVVAMREGRILPFALLQRRLGRKRPLRDLLTEIPVGLMAFDLLYLDGRTVIDEPLAERKKLLGQIAWTEKIQPAPFFLLEERIELAPFFEQAELRRNEGLMLKDAASTYAPGKRGMSWLKWKKALATLDVVVTGVEFGHGRRRDVLSDYTFAVQGGGRLLNIGKAYSGLTDREILEMTDYFKQHTVQDFGRFRLVEPTIVLEVAFNGVQRSSRHASGFALRFPRIVRIRRDKPVEEIDTLETVERIYASHTGAGEQLDP